MELMSTEYAALRDEILSNSQIVALVFTVSITGIAAIIGLGIGRRRGNWIVLLSPFAILIPSMWFIDSQVESTVRMASYISVFHEGVSARGWESRLYEFRGLGSTSDDAYTWSLATFYVALAMLCLLLAWYFFARSDVKRRRPATLVLATHTVGFVVWTPLLAPRLTASCSPETYETAQQLWLEVQQSEAGQRESENPESTEELPNDGMQTDGASRHR